MDRLVVSSSGRLVALLIVMMFATSGSVRGQESTSKALRESQLRLEQIRREREQLQEQMESLQSRVHDVTAEISNVERLVATSAAALKEIDFQTQTLTQSVDSTARLLEQNREQLDYRKLRLDNRLRSIYKRGPLHSVRVLLGAESFGDLMNRYKYLNIITRNDQRLIDDVARLEHELVVQDKALKTSLGQIQQLRDEKMSELTKLRDLEQKQERTLRGYQQRARQTEGRLVQLARDEARITDAIDEIERKRRDDERRRAVAGAPPAETRALTTRELGSLAWPVDGDLVYKFGPERKPNGVVLRNNGIGIAAQPGTPVHAVEDGTVRMARPFEGYGPTVMISHGGGYYTLYLYLSKISVKEGQVVKTGQVVGTVGGEKTPEGAHIEFQVRAPLRGDAPEAVDPLSWLKDRQGS